MLFLLLLRLICFFLCMQALSASLPSVAVLFVCGTGLCTVDIRSHFVCLVKRPTGPELSAWRQATMAATANPSYAQPGLHVQVTLCTWYKTCLLLLQVTLFALE